MPSISACVFGLSAPMVASQVSLVSVTTIVSPPVMMSASSAVGVTEPLTSALGSVLALTLSTAPAIARRRGAESAFAEGVSFAPTACL